MKAIKNERIDFIKMIQTKNITLKFDDFTALHSVDLSVNKGSIFGLVGTNGAGKSTLIRVISGIYTPNEGDVLIDGVNIKDDISIKEKLVYVPDELYFTLNTTMDGMAKHYKHLHPSFDDKFYLSLVKEFDADSKKPILSMSKGMKRQAALILAVACRPELLMIDETFDGLDVIKRKKMHEILCNEVSDREMTVLMATHSMREVDDLCDSLAMIHQGRITLQSDIDDAKGCLVKFQIGFAEEFEQDKVSFDGADIVDFNRYGTVATVTYNNDRDEVVHKLEELNPLILNVMPVSLEDLFMQNCQ